jgi:superfamily I DNA/RNA helicase
MTFSLILDEAQEQIVNFSSNKSLIVVAGPGCGKTLVASQRLHLLVNNEFNVNSDPRKVLAISFTRAAALTIREKIDDDSNVEIRTIDSWCTYLLNELRCPTSEDDSFSYEGNIIRLTELLQNDAEKIPNYSHVVVDEAQDIYGSRRDLIEVLLKSVAKLGGGWTVLGDPAQSIFDFQSTKSGDDISLLVSVSKISPKISTITLGMDYRAKNDEIRKTRLLGVGLRAELPDEQSINDIWKEIESIRKFRLSQLTEFGNRFFNKDLDYAILVRSNREVLTISRELKNAQVPHHIVQPKNGYQILPAWIQELSQCNSEDLIENFYQEHNFLNTLLFKRTLRPFMKTRGSGINEKLLYEAICRPSLDEFFMKKAKHGICLSTIHKAKGLEFDEVFLSLERQINRKNWDELLEARIAFVGLSRARGETMKLDLPVSKEFLTKRISGGRLIDQTFRGNRTKAIEFFAEDAEDLKLVSDGEFADYELHRQDAIGSEFLRYQIVGQDGEVVGRTSVAFGEVIKSLWAKSAPKCFSGVYQFDTQTVLSRPQNNPNNHPWFRLAPLLTGMISPKEENEKET